MAEEIENEVWKPIEWTDGVYMISNLGRVKSRNNTCKGFRPTDTGYRLLKPKLQTSGYLCVQICFNGKRHCSLVHRLVAEAFIPNPNSLPQINHKDEDKKNNKVENLEWCTAKYNLTYNNLHLRRAKSIRKTISKPILQCDDQWNVIKTWDNALDVQRGTGFCNSSIWRACNPHSKRCWTKHKGFNWCYEKDLQTRIEQYKIAR